MSVPEAVWNKIEALKQAHAELAAKVDQMISKAGTDCDKCEGRGWRINVPSQSMYPCTWCAGKGKVNIAALESPAPAPDEVRCYDEEGLRVPCDPLPTADPVCGEDCDGSCQKCEDRMFERIYGGGDELPACSRCGGTLIENNCISRECTAYVPEQTAQDKDRRSALIRLMNMLTLNQVNALGEDDMVLIFGKVGEIHIDEHLRAYGKPGANPKMIVPEKRITFVPTAEPAPLDNDEGMHTLPAKTAAQERYHEANEHHYSNREVEMAAGAFDRAEEVSQELDDWTHLIHMRLNTMSQRIASLESPAPAPDPVCQCGFPYDGKCMRRDCPVPVTECANCGHALSHGRCTNCSYAPTAEPEPAPLDPVRSIMKLVLQYGADTANAAVCYRHNKDKEADDHNEKAYMRTQEIEAAIRAYGRDGAR